MDFVHLCRIFVSLVIDLGYPVLGPDRPTYCGHPQFQLNCSREALVITIKSIDNRVLQIDEVEYVLKVVRTDYWNNTCPEVLRNSTLDATFYDYASDTQALMLYDRCTAVSLVTDAVSSQFQCPNNRTSHTNYFATDSMRNSLSLYTQTCDESVLVHISNSEAGVLEGGTTLSRANLSVALDTGFRMDWNADNSRCGDRASSGGVCVINSTTSEFACYCRDRPYASICGLDSPPGPGPSGLFLESKWRIGIGAAVLGIAVFSVVIICYYKREYISTTRIAFWMTATRDREFDVNAFIRNFESFASKRYSYAAVKRMTNSFAEKIGKGGYGAVYKGKLPDGLPVAVKVLHESKTSDGEEFINEVASI
ncbi:hypothetical protein TIFTF001_051318, partial [Ficus carica]